MITSLNRNIEYFEYEIKSCEKYTMYVNYR